jgi:hypothetical protein
MVASWTVNGNIALDEYGQPYVNDVYIIDGLNSNITLTAAFTPIFTHSIAVTADNVSWDVALSPSTFGGRTQIRNGASATFTFTPDHDVKILGITVNGNPFSIVEVDDDGVWICTIYGVTQNLNIVVSTLSAGILFGGSLELDSATGMLSGITPGDTVEEILEQLTITGDMDLVFYRFDGTPLAHDEKVGTGTFIKVDGSDDILATVVIAGDVTGSGDISIFDVQTLHAHVSGLITLEGAFLKAGKVTGGQTISIFDIQTVFAYISGLIDEF